MSLRRSPREFFTFDRAHDRLFRFSFVRVYHALRGSMSDLLFSVRFIGSERRALAYLLWEHMHGSSRLMSLRMVNYGGRALRDYVERDDAIDGYLPVLVPIVIVQSGSWADPRLLSELHALPGEPPPPRVYMDLEMIVHELHEDSLPAEELTTLARATLGLLRLTALRQLISENAERIAQWLAQVHHAHGYDDFRALLEYIARAGSEEGLMQAIIEHSDENLGWEAMSIADKLEARGRAEMLLQMLEHRFGRVPHTVKTRVLAATAPQLDAWALRLLDATTLDELWGEP